MPIIVCLKNGLQLAVHGDTINPAEWKPKSRVEKTAMNGHPIMINASEVVMLELFTPAEFSERAEKMRAAKDAAQDGGRRVVQPVPVIPRGR